MDGDRTSGLDRLRSAALEAAPRMGMETRGRRWLTVGGAFLGAATGAVGPAVGALAGYGIGDGIDFAKGELSEGVADADKRTQALGIAGAVVGAAAGAVAGPAVAGSVRTAVGLGMIAGYGATTAGVETVRAANEAVAGWREPGGPEERIEVGLEPDGGAARTGPDREVGPEREGSPIVERQDPDGDEETERTNGGRRPGRP